MFFFNLSFDSCLPADNTSSISTTVPSSATINSAVTSDACGSSKPTLPVAVRPPPPRVRKGGGSF